MYKYRNISDFRQSLVIKGKRVLLKPEDVIESEHEIKSVFLEPVDPSTPATATQGTSVTEMAVTKSQETSASVKDLEKRVTDLAGLVSILKQTVDDLTEGVKTNNTGWEKDKQLFIRRMEMLKSAVMTIEEEVFGKSENPQGK